MIAEARGSTPWWRVAPPVFRREGAQEHRAEAQAILAAVRAYLTDPEWAALDDEERTELIHAAVVPLWQPEDAERLMQAVADVDGALRAEDDVLEEITAALRDGTDPSLELHTITPDTACEFIRQHHRHLPECNRRGIVHALAARWRGQIIAVATTGAPTGRWGRDSACPPEGFLEITRVASIAGLRRVDRRGRHVPVSADSSLVALLIDPQERARRVRVPPHHLPAHLRGRRHLPRSGEQGPATRRPFAPSAGRRRAQGRRPRGHQDPLGGRSRGWGAELEPPATATPTRGARRLRRFRRPSPCPP